MSATSAPAIEVVHFEIDWLPLVPANAWYKDRWTKTANVKDWRAAGFQAGSLFKLPRDWQEMFVTGQARHATNQLTDFDAMAPAMKAVVDGLVLGPKKLGWGVVLDDSPEYVKGLTLLPSFCDRSKRPALLVTLERLA